MIDERQVALARMTSPEAAEALAGAEGGAGSGGRYRAARSQHDPGDGHGRGLPTRAAHRRGTSSPRGRLTAAPVWRQLSSHGLSRNHDALARDLSSRGAGSGREPQTTGGALLHHRRARWQPGRARRADDEATVSDGDSQPTSSTSPSWTTSCAKVRRNAGDTRVRWRRRWGWRCSQTSCVARHWRWGSYSRPCCRTVTSSAHPG